MPQHTHQERCWILEIKKDSSPFKGKFELEERSWSCDVVIIWKYKEEGKNYQSKISLYKEFSCL
jgi:hypothetical protein